ncbi:DNA primase [Tsuneonella sp. CC-YZS046]|uniref:DNA primase n=1 Tax=Tsuneonella sp. CC-YZS046 TaxID=3042152 RepID=UPI002D78B4F2|nr:DNA primase [Tsuneonella sp. CC-YZS046]WRO67642.1 DNA primase [Tsuneonella sp. CC-YZS046]
MALSPQWLDELRARVTLSAIIGRTTKIHKVGREWKACCPFHNEKTPSFTINDEKGFYHCFGCGAHGDVIRWMTDQRGLSFMDAVKELAAQAGMEVPAPDPHAARQAEQRATLVDVMTAAQDWFRAQLTGPDGEAARRYLGSRGFKPATIEAFGFGYAAESRNALRHALARFDEDLLIEAGLRIAVEERDPYDRFRGRLMLPIQDARGRVIAFGGRILESSKTDAPKYLNSPDTPLFDKGRTLYNLHRAAPASRQTERIVVVEGYMDVIALADAGIAEAVAPMGTALTERQIELLWRIGNAPILCFDGDAAGQRAAMRAIARALPLLRPGHTLRIVRLPSGLDPDDLIRRDGRAALEELLAGPSSMLDTLWQHERDALPLATPEDKAGLKQRLLEHVEMIAHPDIRALYRRDLMDRFSAFAFPARPPRFSPRRDGDKRPALDTSPEAMARLRRINTGASRDKLAGAVLAGLARHPDQIDRHAEALSALAVSDPSLEEAVDLLIEAADILEHGGAASILGKLANGVEPKGMRFSFLADDFPTKLAREDLAEAVGLLIERPALERALAAATDSFASDPEGAYAEQQRLLKRKLAFEERLRQMASKRAALPAHGVAAPNNDAAQDRQKLD